MEIRPKQNKTVISILLALILISTTGLWTSPWAFAGSSRGKLSDAMEKAATEHEGDRTVPAESSDDSYDSPSQSCFSTCLGLPFDLLLGIFTSRKTDRQEAAPSGPETEIPTNTDEPESPAADDDSSIYQQIPPEGDSGGEVINSGTIDPENGLPENFQKDGQAHAPMETSSVASPKTREKSRRSTRRDNFLLFSGGIGALKQDDFHPLQYLQIGIGGYLEEHARLEAYIGGAWASVKETGNLDKSIQDAIGIATAGVQLKYFFTPRHTFLGAYALAGIAYNHLFWSYENPIRYEDETIYRDDLAGFELYAGLGLSIALFPNFQIGAEAAPGYLLWGPTTSEGFENDVFGPFSSIKFKTAFTYLY